MDDQVRKQSQIQKVSGKLFRSRALGWFLNQPPFSWLLSGFTRRLMNRIMAEQNKKYPVAESIHIQAANLEATFDQIVQDVVHQYRYCGAILALQERGDILPVRAFYMDPEFVSMDQVAAWEAELSNIAGEKISLMDPAIAKVYIYDEKYKNNLSVRAYQAHGPITDKELYSLFVPIVPEAARPVIKGIQDALGIEEVIAVPFFIQSLVDGELVEETIGNLFAASQKPILEEDIKVLAAYGRQAAVALENKRRRVLIQAAQELSLRMHGNLQSEEIILQHIAMGVVHTLGYSAAMVSNAERDDLLPVQAYYIDPGLAPPDKIERWTSQIARLMGEDVEITDSGILHMVVSADGSAENLGMQAARLGKPVVHPELFSVMAAVVPQASRQFVSGLQKALGIQQVIAVPFFIDHFEETRNFRELLGVVYAASRSQRFSVGDIRILEAFGQQAALGIHNARLFRKAEERRQIAQRFGVMAFSASASVHQLRNDLMVVRGYLDLLDRSEAHPHLNQMVKELRGKMEDILERDKRLLDSLSSPWQRVPEASVNVNNCLTAAIGKVVNQDVLDLTNIRISIYDERTKAEIDTSQDSQRNETAEFSELLASSESQSIRTKTSEVKTIRRVIRIHHHLTPNLPEIMTSSEMLTEAFRILIKNAVESLIERARGNLVEIESVLRVDGYIEVRVKDNGLGIKPEHLSRIFDLGWTTKERGMGFGLFWVKDFVEGLGGSIQAESNWTKGAEFCIFLPTRSEESI